MFSGTHSEAASYEFTTLTTVPGTLTHNGARIQVLDLPGTLSQYVTVAYRVGTDI
jgi:ribosome-interacting GTPase 1